MCEACHSRIHAIALLGDLGAEPRGGEARLREDEGCCDMEAGPTAPRFSQSGEAGGAQLRLRLLI